jgi:hypothetical protein
MVCVLTTVHVTPSGEVEPVTLSPTRAQRTQYGSTAGAVPVAVFDAREPVSTRYSTVTGTPELALKVTGMLTVPAFSKAAMLAL